MEANSVWKQGLPIWEYSSMVILTSIPKWAQTLFGNGLATEPSPIGNRDPFLYGDPHIEMGICSICFPIWKRGSKERLHFHMGMCLSPFPYGNHYMETGVVSSGSLYGNGDSPFPYGDVSIPVLW